MVLNLSFHRGFLLAFLSLALRVLFSHWQLGLLEVVDQGDTQ